MVNLSFTDKELETLNEYFQSELYKAEQKIDSIKGILGKIGKKQGKPGKEAKSSKKHGRNKSVLKSEIKLHLEKKKPGRKPKNVTDDLVKIVEKNEVPAKRGRPLKNTVEKGKVEKTEPKLKAGPKGKVAAKSKIATKSKSKVATKSKLADFNWETGVLGIISDNPQLTASQISESLISLYNLKGSKLNSADENVNEQLLQLEKAGTIMAYGDEGADFMYGLKPTE